MNTLAESVLPCIRLNSPVTAVRTVLNTSTTASYTAAAATATTSNNNNSSSKDARVEVFVVGEEGVEEVVKGRRVVVTVPLSILQLKPPPSSPLPSPSSSSSLSPSSSSQRQQQQQQQQHGHIRFEPPLPLIQQEGIGTLGMGNALK